MEIGGELLPITRSFWNSLPPRIAKGATDRDIRDDTVSKAYRRECILRAHLARCMGLEFTPLLDRTEDLRNNKRCDWCQVHKTPMRTCSGCRVMRYCSRRCQRMAWKQHRNSCDPNAQLPSHVAPLSITYVAWATTEAKAASDQRGTPVS